MNIDYIEQLKMIKEKLELQNNNFQRREEIIIELKDLSKLHNDVKDYIIKLEKLVSLYPTVANKNKLEEYIKQEQDYVALINEYAEELNNIGSTINIEDSQKKLETLEKFNDICEEIKKIEKLSKKAKKSNNSFTETFNSEGRKKVILSELADEYDLLVRKKKDLFMLQKEAYDYFKSFDVVMKKENQNNYDNIDYYNDKRINNYQGYSEDIDILEQMTDEEKIIYYQNRMDNIMRAKNTGKKVRIKINGSVYSIPKKMEAEFRKYVCEINKITTVNNQDNVVNNEDISVEVVDDVDKTVSENVVLSQDVNPENKELNLSLDKVETKVESNNDDKKEDQVELGELTYDNPFDENIDDLYSFGQDDNDVEYEAETRQFSFKNISGKVLSFASVLKSKLTSRFNSKVYKVRNVRTSENKDILRKRVLKVTAISLVGVAAVSSLAAFTYKNNVKKYRKGFDHNIYDIVDTTEADDNDDLIDTDIKEYDISEEIKDQVDITIDCDKKNNNDIVFGDVVKIASDSKIYNNMYDASNKTNGFKPYFDAEQDRYVGGISINYNENMIFLQYNEDNAQEKLKSFIADGAIIETICTVNNNGYEGFYNIDDISLVDIVNNKNTGEEVKTR